MWRSLILATALVCATTVDARADLKEGDKPQQMGADAEYINCDDFDLVKMRSKVVILQLAHTKSDPCKEQVAKLKELLKKYSEQGLHIVTAFEEPKDVVQSFVDANGIEYPVVANVRDLRTRWAPVKGFPTSYILDVTGKIAWIGNFADQADVTIAALLKKVSDRPWLPAQYAAIAAHLDSDSFGDARTALTEALAAENVIADDRKRLDAMMVWIDAQADKALAEASELRAKGNYYEVYKAYLAVAKLHPGSTAADTATATADALMADKKSRREIEGWKFFEEQFEAAKEIEMKDRKKAISLLKKVMSRFRGTAAAEKAKYWVDRLSE